MALKLELSGLTDTGKVRPNNEDALLVDAALGLAIVADGMGGHNAGEVASRMAVESIHSTMKKFIEGSQNQVLGKIQPDLSPRANQLASSFRLANQLVYESGKANVKFQGMGTTVDALLIDKNHACFAHVGDSRIYLLRAGELKLITNDHSVVAEQLRDGLISEEQARKSHFKHILTRALGNEEQVAIDVKEMIAQAGDLFVMCTDGLNKTVEDAEILELARRMTSTQNFCSDLVRLANERGGVDNVTVAAVRYLG